MKRYLWGFIGLCSVGAGLAVWWELGSERSVMLQGRPLIDWVREADAEALGGDQTPNKVLYAEGPRILPELARLLFLQEATWVERLPNRWILGRIRVRYENRTRIKSNAADVIGVIANRNPCCAELPSAVPGLVHALTSGSSEVRYKAAQGLGAVGPVASNAIPTLLEHAKERDSSVRFCSVEALGRIGLRTSEALQAVRSAFRDPDPGVRDAATNALMRLQPELDIYAQPFTPSHQETQ